MKLREDAIAALRAEKVAGEDDSDALLRILRRAQDPVRMLPKRPRRDATPPHAWHMRVAR
jgi:hypothetical protein